MASLAFRPASRNKTDVPDFMERKTRPGVPLPLIIEDKKRREKEDQRKRPEIRIPISHTPMEEPPMGKRPVPPTRGVVVIEPDEVKDDSGWVDNWA